jgi:DNA-binding transcriptional LysR family regulator
MIDLQQLKTFCTVVEKKSFTKAQEIVHRTQSTISSQISALERFYNTPLFDRSSREIKVTDNGKILYEYAKKIIELAEKSKNAIYSSKQIIKGELLIGASTIPGTYILPEILSVFKKKYSEVNISMQITNSKDIITKIVDHTLEIGIVGEKLNDTRLEYINIAKDRIVLIVPQNHKWAKKSSIPLKDIRKESFLSREEGSGTKATLESILKTKGINKLNTSISLGSTEAIKEGVKAGLGPAFISEWAIRDKSLKTISIENFDIVRHFYIVFLKNSVKNNIIETFIKFIKKDYSLS